MPVRPSGRAAAAAVALVVAAAAAGAVLWWTLGRDDPDRDCAGLRRDDRIRTVLGGTWRSGLPCGELAEGLRRAAVGAGPGSHTPDGARALRAVLLAAATGPDHRVHPALRRPLAEALADYAADTHAVLTGIDDSYLAHDAPDADVWQDGRGVHVAVPKDRLVAVVRGLSEDPAAYAVLRAADLRQGAAGLGALPSGASGAALTDAVVRSASPAGVFDGIADDALRGRDAAARGVWRADALGGLAPNGDVPPFGTDPAGHLAEGWLQRGAGAPDGIAALRDQAAGLVALWAEAVRADTGRIGLPALQDRARTTTDRERVGVKEQLKQDAG
ncbi:hypothetical protein OH807_05525 [Kitasatospora sp. NBC_01560]|uniref:hypothetical protein n=1 Tax=Kitasatospora sp. NBC_01560 TaxID=2975965 RepID=UPI00386F5FE9